MTAHFLHTNFAAIEVFLNKLHNLHIEPRNHKLRQIAHDRSFQTQLSEDSRYIFIKRASKELEREDITLERKIEIYFFTYEKIYVPTILTRSNEIKSEDVDLEEVIILKKRIYPCFNIFESQMRFLRSYAILQKFFRILGEKLKPKNIYKYFLYRINKI